MKKLNIPLILFLAIGSLVTVVGIWFLHGYQVSRSAERLLARAEAAATSGDVEEQIRLLRRYLRYRPEDVENLKKLLETSRDQLFKAEDVSIQEVGMLLSSLEKAIRDNPEDADLRRQGYIFSAGIGRYGDALDHLVQLESMGEITSEDQIVMARCQWLKGDTDKAMRLLSDLIGFDLATRTFDDAKATAPQEVNAYALLALIEIRNSSDSRDLTVPQMIVDKAIERNPDSVDAYLRRASFYQENVEGKDGKEKSLADIKKSLELSPDDPMVILAAASTAMALGDVDWAAQLVDDGLQKHPADPDLYAKRAEVARVEGKTEEALEIIIQGLDKNQMNRELLYRRGSYEVDLGRLDEARTTIERLGNRFDPMRLDVLRARILMAENDFLGAAKKLESLRPMAAPESRAQTLITELLVNCYRRLNQPDMIERLVGTQTDNAQSRFNQAEAYARQGKYDDATKIYEDLLQSDDTLTPEGREAVFNRLFAILIQIERTKPESQRDWTKVDRMAELLVQKMNLRDAALAQFEIEMLINKNLVSEARKKAEEGVSRYPRNSSFRLLLAQLTTDFEQAMRIMDQLEQMVGDSVTLRLTRADHFVREGGPEMSNRLKVLEENLSSFTDDDQTKLWQGLAAAYRRAGLPGEAIRAWRELLQQNEKNLSVRVVIFDLAVEAGDLATMDDMLGEIATVAGKDSSEWLVGEARRQLWLLQNGQSEKIDLQDVTSLLQKAKAARPDFAPIYMVQAEVQLLEGQSDAAIESMRAALQKRPGEVAYLQRLADLLMSLGRMDEARVLLSQLPEQQKRANDMISEIQLLLSQDPKKAVERAEEVFPANSDDANVLLNLVEVYQAANQVAESLPVLQRAIQLDPTATRPWLTYIRSLVSLGRKDDAKAAIEKLKTVVPAENLTLVLGQSYATVSEFESAEQVYEQGLQREPNNTVLLRNQALLLLATQQPDKLRACLNRLVAVQPGDDQQKQIDVAWGRRALAQQMASSGTYQDFQAALQILEQNAVGGAELTGDDLGLWLRLCAGRPEVASRRMAVDRLNKIRNQRSLSSGENAVLAYIYHAEGRWPEAQTLMIDILAKNPGNVAYVTTYIDWLLEQKDYADAAAWIRKLNPESAEAIRYTSILLTLQGKASDAAKRLQSFVPKRIDELTAVRMMEELGKYDERFYKLAQRQWKSLAAKNSQLIHSYIDYLARMPKAAGLDEALELSEKQLQQAVKDQRADLAEFYLDLGIKALRSHRKSLPDNSPHYQRVQGWFELARQAQVNDVTLTWNQVDLSDVRRDYDKLATLYEALLKRSELNDLQRAVIRNNLAYVYAITNKGDQALAIIGDAISQLGPRSDFLDTRGLAYLASGQFDNAVTDLRTAVSGGQGDAATYFHLALAEHRSGNIDEADRRHEARE